MLLSFFKLMTLVWPKFQHSINNYKHLHYNVQLRCKFLFYVECESIDVGITYFSYSDCTTYIEFCFKQQRIIYYVITIVTKGFYVYA